MTRVAPPSLASWRKAVPRGPVAPRTRTLSPAWSPALRSARSAGADGADRRGDDAVQSVRDREACRALGQQELCQPPVDAWHRARGGCGAHSEALIGSGHDRPDHLDAGNVREPHAGAFLAALAAGLPPEAAARRANAAAALAVTCPGLATARAELDAWLASGR
jgi:hypothetical protein